jgi:hypothetical protein
MQAIAASILAEVVRDLSDQGEEVAEIPGLQDEERRPAIGAAQGLGLPYAKPKEQPAERAIAAAS